MKTHDSGNLELVTPNFASRASHHLIILPRTRKVRVTRLAVSESIHSMIFFFIGHCFQSKFLMRVTKPSESVSPGESGMVSKEASEEKEINVQNSKDCPDPDYRTTPFPTRDRLSRKRAKSPPIFGGGPPETLSRTRRRRFIKCFA